MQHTYIDKIAYIYLKDKKVLVTLSKGKDTWYIPGGKREHGETDYQALIREVKEELSVDLQPETIAYYGTFEGQAHGELEGTMVRMTCYLGDFEGKMYPAAEIQEMAYFTYAQKLRVSHVDHLIFDDLKEKGLIE